MPNVSDSDARALAVRMYYIARDSDSFEVLTAIVAFVLLLFEELASLTDHRFEAELRDYPLEPFFASKVHTHDSPLYLRAAFLRWLMFGF